MIIWKYSEKLGYCYKGVMLHFVLQNIYKQEVKNGVISFLNMRCFNKICIFILGAFLITAVFADFIRGRSFPCAYAHTS